jgi:hypothetical protein
VEKEMDAEMKTGESSVMGRGLMRRSPFANGATFVAFELAMRAMN